MDWLERMKSAMDYIEMNLADNISYDDIACNCQLKIPPHEHLKLPHL
ncbi:hypothetical protein PAAL109150_21975 [Paenibacillus alkaliterrae]